jgi:formylmethanofuran dehydrogenase subunit E
MSKDIKVIYRGNKSPSGKNNNTEYMISSERLKQLEASKMFDIEVIDKPKAKPKKKTKKEKK